MSKSLGNIIDPLDVSEKYGTDAVRLSLVLGTTPGNDLMLSEDKIAGFRNFTNKLWNIGRYIISLPSDENDKISNYKIQISKLALADKWILSRLNRMIQEVTDDLENFRFSQAGEKLRSFTWDEFADWYIEINKIQPNPKLITSIFKSLICLWHPFMPFVTEALWKELKEKNLLMIANWPKANKRLINQKAEKDFQFIQDIIKTIRNLRAEFKIDPSKFVNVLIISKEASLIKKESEIIKRLGRVGSLEISKIGRKPKNSATAVVKSAEIYLLLEGLVDIEKEKERIKKELEEANQYLTVIINKLNNKNFINRAPKEIVITEKNKYKELRERIKKLQEYLKNL
jgi:valyl-tRNA synthetase